MYIKALEKLNVEELINLLKPIDEKRPFKKVDMEKIFDTVINKLQSIDFNNEYENTYKEYIINKYNSKKSLFIPKTYLKSDKAKSSNYSHYQNNISIDLELVNTPINNKGGEYLYDGVYRETVVEWDDTLELVFRSFDDIFGESIRTIKIPYQHRKDYSKFNNSKEDIGYIKEERKINKDTITKLNDLIERIEKELIRVKKYIELYYEVFEEDELKEYKQLEKICTKRLKKLNKIKKALLENKYIKSNKK